ncbi:unknown [Clostridium sp. CAG:1193]|mgnify:FL=1|nr:unknown [Clostridium sp. CAG:1193]
MKTIFKFIKKFVLSGFTLFAFNIMASPLNFQIPINLFTILFMIVFGFLSLPFFAVLLIFFF